MSTRSRNFQRFASFALLALGSVSISLAKPSTQVVKLADSIIEGVKQGTIIGAPSPSQTLTIGVALTPSNMAGLEAMADAVSDPNSPNYRHFLTPEQIAASFAAAPVDVNNVVNYLKSQGMTIKLVARNHMGILATATVAQAQAAFGTSIKTLSGPGVDGKPTTFIANVTPVSVPANIAHAVQCVTGLETWVRPQMRTTLTPSQARSLYNTAPSYANGFTGAGVKLGISNWDGFKLSNADLFISAYGLPVPAGGSHSNCHVVSVSGSNNNTTGAVEGDLDIQMELATAPLADIYIYDSTADLYPTILQESSDNIADVISESYGWRGYTNAYWTSVHGAHVAMSTQGQTYLAASGDNGATGINGSTAYAYPDVDPEVVNVGGTVATLNGSNTRQTEVGWSGSGGGWNTSSFGTVNFNTQPSWQTGNGVPNKGFRLVPDIGLHASSSGGAYDIYYNGVLTTGYVGTSFASPMTAGCLGTLEQRLTANGQTGRFGRINNLLYAENGRSDIWFDITSGSNGKLPDGTTSNATVGWDFVTGWGAPNFDAWYTALAAQTVTPASLNVFRGVTVSGNLASLATIDKNYLAVHAGFTTSPSESPIQLIIGGTSNLASASNLEVDVTGHASTGGLTQYVEAYNWTTSAYVLIDSRAAPTADATIKLTVANPNQYIQSGTKAVQVRVRYSQTGFTTGFPWQTNVDQVIWRVTP